MLNFYLRFNIIYFKRNWWRFANKLVCVCFFYRSANIILSDRVNATKMISVSYREKNKNYFWEYRFKIVLDTTTCVHLKWNAFQMFRTCAVMCVCIKFRPWPFLIPRRDCKNIHKLSRFYINIFFYFFLRHIYIVYNTINRMLTAICVVFSEV